MTNKIAFTVDDNELFRNLVRLQYEVDARKEVLGYLIGTNNMTSDAFFTYQEEYLNLYKEYSTIKAQFEQEIV